MLPRRKIDKNLSRKLKKQQKQQEEAVYIPKPEKKEGIPTAILCDIDGTLAKMVARGPYETDKYHTDEAHEEVKKLLDMVKRGSDVKIILFTSRMEAFQDETEKWLRHNFIRYDGIYMRNTGDVRQDIVIKKELYEKHIKGRYNVLFIIEDRKRVIDMWRKEGFFVFDCNQTGKIY